MKKKYNFLLLALILFSVFSCSKDEESYNNPGAQIPNPIVGKWYIDKLDYDPSDGVENLIPFLSEGEGTCEKDFLVINSDGSGSAVRYFFDLEDEYCFSSGATFSWELNENHFRRTYPGEVSMGYDCEVLSVNNTELKIKYISGGFEDVAGFIEVYKKGM